MSWPGPSHEPRSKLHRRRDELAEQVAELQWNLGGLAYEMAIRDHFRLDVLVRRAAMLQERDAELAEVERVLHMEESAVAGSCSSCGAVRSRGAVFCWQCGAKVMERSTVVSDEVDTPTAEIDTTTAKLHTETTNGNSDRTTAQPVQTLVVTPQELGRPIQASR
jgi:uncharacterized Zn finger protein (UPF0148 family)